MIAMNEHECTPAHGSGCLESIVAPEPAAWALFGIGLALLLVVAWRRRTVRR